MTGDRCDLSFGAACFEQHCHGRPAQIVELSSGTIDREWPHQVALPAEGVRGRNCTIIDRFCRGLSICSRHQYYRKDDREFIAYCFAEQRDAEYFQIHFGGELMTAATRPPRYPKLPRRTI